MVQRHAGVLPLSVKQLIDIGEIGMYVGMRYYEIFIYGAHWTANLTCHLLLVHSCSRILRHVYDKNSDAREGDVDYNKVKIADESFGKY